MSAPLFGNIPKATSPRLRRGGWSWGPVEGARLRVLSLGAGVQSSTLVCMMIERELPWVDHIIMADTGDESRFTVEHAAWLRGEVAKATNGQVGFHIVSRGARLSDQVRSRAAAGDDRYVSIPLFVRNGRQGRRQCTREFKTMPMERKQRELLGFQPRDRIPPRSCETWIGITTDEVIRAGAAFASWNRYPLLEHSMSRVDCERWLVVHGFPVPPKSACVFCPFMDNSQRRWLRDNDPEAWQAAIEIDRLVRSNGSGDQQFVHVSCKPLETVDLRTDEEAGQGWLELCEGGCGL